MVRDNVTGLIWENKTDDGTIHDKNNKYTWFKSNPDSNGGNAGIPENITNTEDFIKALNDAHFGGYSDWRLPSNLELIYIVNYSLVPAIDTRYFSIATDTGRDRSLYYYSSESSQSAVNFYDGSFPFSSNDYYQNFVRAVRGRHSESRDISFFDNGTITDKTSGMMWQRDPSPDRMTWEQALAYCEGLNLGGYTDWRLPTIKELPTLLYIINNHIGYTTWTSTSYVDVPSYADSSVGYAWSMPYMRYGYYNAKSDDYLHVHAVRDQSVLSVSPYRRIVTSDAGTTEFSVTNTGAGTMPWTATVAPDSSWLHIQSGGSGTDTGTITCSFDAGSFGRGCTIQVTAAGATDSPVDVTVIQAPTSTESLAMSFVGSGLWIYNSGNATWSPWSQISSVNPENMIFSGSTLYVDFGSASGLQKWDGTAWSQLPGSDPVIMAVSN